MIFHAATSEEGMFPKYCPNCNWGRSCWKELVHYESVIGCLVCGESYARKHSTNEWWYFETYGDCAQLRQWADSEENEPCIQTQSL